eukprot:s1406_g11.t1
MLAGVVGGVDKQHRLKTCGKGVIGYPPQYSPCWQMRHELSICASFLGRCHQTITEWLFELTFCDLGKPEGLQHVGPTKVSDVVLLPSCRPSILGTA